jgi:hypothetical protein
MDIKILHLLGDHFQVVDVKENTVLYQGSIEACVAYKDRFENI